MSTISNRDFRRRAILLLMLTLVALSLLLAACRSAAPIASPPPPAPTAATTPTAPLEEPVTPTAAETNATQSGADTTATPIPVAAAATAADLPAPHLLDVPWQDRSLFEVGLQADQQAVLETLPGASVYHLDLTIENDLTAISGRQEVYYTNQEDTPLTEVVFHLYPNILGGSLTVSEVTINGETATPELQFENSVLRVPLPTALQPGEQIVLGTTFSVTVPNTIERNYGILAQVNGILALAHFYPMLAVYDERGWDVEIPAPEGDVVFADTSFYLVRVTAPADQQLVASGVVVDRTANDDQQTLTLAAGPMRDFYLASNDTYQQVSESVAGTTINSYFLPQHEEVGRQVLTYAVDALESFNTRYGPYPFTELDVVPTINGALGIEYPGLVVINARLYDPGAHFGDTPTSTFAEATVAHEVAHQWFYSLVGNDQLDDPWLDEALAQYATWRYYLDLHDQAGADGFENSLHARWDRVDDTNMPIGLPVADYSGAEYGAIVYGRGPLFFDALAKQMGQETLDAALKDYAQTYRWRIANDDALKQVLENHCACDLTDMFAEWVY